MQTKVPDFNPWDRTGIRYTLPWDVTTEKRDYFGKFDEFIVRNKGLDCTTKFAALTAAPFVVSLISYNGSQRLFMCSGMIVSSNKVDDDEYCSMIMTSATLLNCPTPTREHDIKVDVYHDNGLLYEGSIVGYDLNYNIAAIVIKSSTYLEPARIGNIDGSTDIVRRSSSSSFQLLPHRDTSVTLTPDMAVIGLGRYCNHPYHIMAAPGAFRLLDSNLDCAELLLADCEMTKVGIGGPIITYNGFVIGMSFYGAKCTPFLPINIALKCLEHLQNNRKVPQPWLGVKVSDLDIACVGELEILHRTFPGLMEGVVVRQVDTESPASRAGLCMGDVLVQLDGKPLGRSLKFMSLMLDSVFKPVELIVKRPGSVAPLTLTLIPQRRAELNRWPVPEERSVFVPDR